MERSIEIESETGENAGKFNKENLKSWVINI